MDKLVEKFCDKKFLKKKHVLKIEGNENREYVYLEDPIVLARLAGEIKHGLGRPSLGSQVFMRGQTEDFSGMIPSLFRMISNEGEFLKRYSAYKELGQKIKNISKAKRFEGEIGNAILQHYGIDTPWLDLVDNIFIALWFACWNRVKYKDGYKYQMRHSGEYGWIYFLQFEYGKVTPSDVFVGKKTKYCDLRTGTNSLVLRAHTQHGIFGALTEPKFSNCNMNQYIIATVKFPLNKFVSL